RLRRNLPEPNPHLVSITNSKTSEPMSNSVTKGNDMANKQIAIVSVSNKAGVGKSVTSKSLGLLYRELGKTLAVYDGDGLVGGLLPALGTRSEKGGLQRNQDATVGCGYYDFRDDEKATQFLDVIEENPSV